PLRSRQLVRPVPPHGGDEHPPRNHRHPLRQSRPAPPPLPPHPRRYAVVGTAPARLGTAAPRPLPPPPVARCPERPLPAPRPAVHGRSPALLRSGGDVPIGGARVWEGRRRRGGLEPATSGVTGRRSN